jgi:hypothetical protein
MDANRTPDELADARAASSHAVITLAEALALGLTYEQVRQRRASGRWLSEARGVYRVAGAPVTWQQRAYVACVAGPATARASHLTAAALFGLADAPTLPSITVPTGSSARSRLARVHRADLVAADVMVVARIPVTRPHRTLVDCASVLRQDALDALVDTALFRGLATRDSVTAAIERAETAPGRRGLPALRRSLEVWVPGPAPGSPREMRTIRRIVAWGLPMPVRQHVVRDDNGRTIATLDLAWPELKIGVEYDGLESHGPRRALPDELREARVEARGWCLLRAEKADLRPGATRFRDELLRAFARRAA